MYFFDTEAHQKFIMLLYLKQSWFTEIPLHMLCTFHISLVLPQEPSDAAFAGQEAVFQPVGFHNRLSDPIPRVLASSLMTWMKWWTGNVWSGFGSVHLSQAGKATRNAIRENLLSGEVCVIERKELGTFITLCPYPRLFWDMVSPFSVSGDVTPVW
jgi:hypothetical protein